ncbi:MAG: hypothetical protein V3S89_14305 [Desulfobacterales bacterium]
MKRRSSISVLFAALLVLPILSMSAEGQELIEPIGNGSINWSTAVIQAKGIGAPPEKYWGKPQARPMALRAAQLDAMRNLLETTKGVQIDAKTTVVNFMVDSDVISAKVQGMVKGARIVKQEYLSDGTVEITMQMSMNGGFAQLVLPQDIKQIEPIKPIAPTAPRAQAPAPPQDQPSVALPKEEKAVYTGLVVDARGINVRPAMAPKILDENGQEVYGSAFVSREFAVQQGMSGYARDLTAAQSNTRVTNSPLTVKGLRIEGSGRSDVIISNADASRLRSASEHLSFLKRCRVMIVVD